MTRRYAYDLADRRLTDSVGTKLATQSSYDRAGNDTLTLKPGSVSVRTTFDALNRPAQRRALGRVSQFTYDAMGNVVAADNPYAQIRRSYFANGLVQADTLRISTTDTTSATRWTSHVYGLVFGYDLNGRRISHSYPGQLLPAGTSGSTSYAYNPQSAALDSVTDPFGNSYRFGYDAMDRLQTYKAASFPADTFSYDLESRLTRRTRVPAGQPTDILSYDLRGKVLANTGSNDAATYLPIGPVKTLGVASEGRTEQYITDALGQRRWSSVLAGNQDGAIVQWSIFEPVTARLLKTYPLANNPRSDTTFYFYQVDGTRREANAKHFIWKQQGGGCAGSACLDYTEIRNTLDDYDGEGHLATSTFLLDTLAGAKSLPATYKPYRVYTTYRYDALGRRVWARTMRGTNCAAKLNVSAVCVSTVTRTVWDGAQVLFEVRAAGDSLAGSAMEDDASTNPKYGRVGYVHGMGIDAPLAIFKGSQRVVPHATWRGIYDRGSCLPAPCPSGLQFPGGNGSASVWGPSGVDPDKADWYGSLIWDQQDATGYQYKRNRYYEPGTGRFTQEDPIGLAGGLNLYGFASGDPVNFSDPFGLMSCPPECGEVFEQLGRMAPAMQRAITGATAVTLAPIAIAAGAEAVAGGAAMSTLGVARPLAGRALLPAVPTAITKLQTLGEKFGVSATQLANRAITSGMKLVDNAEANAGNINALLPRLDGVSGWIRVTLDPTQSRIISAGLQSANQVINGLKSGRFTPFE
jgi:RHS repeat-associated protein